MGMIEETIKEMGTFELDKHAGGGHAFKIGIITFPSFTIMEGEQLEMRLGLYGQVESIRKVKK